MVSRTDETKPRGSTSIEGPALRVGLHVTQRIVVSGSGTITRDLGERIVAVAYEGRHVVVRHTMVLRVRNGQVERVSVFYEKGEGAIAYREAGRKDEQRSWSYDAVPRQPSARGDLEL